MNARFLLPGLLLVLSASASVGAEAPRHAPVGGETPVHTPASKNGSPCVPVIENAWVRAAPPAAKTLAGYLVLRNPCTTTVVVTGVESLDFGMPMIHRSEIVDGVGRMRPAGRLEVAPGDTLRFEPNGLHLMLMQPARALPEGTTARIRLVLADGRRIYAEFPVRRTPPAGAG